MQNNNNFSERLKQGNKYEHKVLKSLLRKGEIADIVEPITVNGNTFQAIWINNEWIRCPDIRVYKSNNKNEIILRIEVKSYGEYYLNKFDKIKELLPNIKCVTIKKEQHDDYLELLRSEEITIKIVFYIIESNEWYWIDLWELENIEKFFGYAYRDREMYYVCPVENLYKDFNKFL